MTIVRSLRVVIEMPTGGRAPTDQLEWVDRVFRVIESEGGQIGSWGIMEEEID